MTMYGQWTSPSLHWGTISSILGSGVLPSVIRVFLGSIWRTSSGVHLLPRMA